jgi:hypothetical protein
MRIIELPSGVRHIISNEEALLLDQISAAPGHMFKKDLDERSQQVARDLTQRSVLTRHTQDGKLVYKLCDPNIWRI